ncbi:NAD(P)/FAD-dependent oxidoreductase [Microbacterium sp. 1P10UB]|uniref:flavin-containing monooxygenase n=1 Tax=unclassified Microbacterium TaxID=2609290 RepID=UPI0039A21F85
MTADLPAATRRSAAPDRVEVAIVGAGFAGLGMAMALRRAGRESFVVLERGDGVGGTWRDNTYPGVACDVPSHLYGFAAHPNPHWSGVYARGDEIRDYLTDVARREDLGERVRLRTPMLSASWIEAASGAGRGAGFWRIETGGDHAGVIEADALVLACGRLTEPEVPEIAGLETFPGALFHSARWDHATDLEGARIAVVGTGASAVQLVPELARRAEHVTLFQRTPAWIVPRGARPYSAEERELFAARPDLLDRLRAQLYAEGEARFASRSGDATAAADAREAALAHLHAQVADETLRAQLTPRYAFGCKRVLLSDEFYPAVASDRVTLEPSALVSVEGSTLVSASGERHHADVLVLATGFASTRQPYAGLVRGVDGVTLDEHWDDGMTSFGSTVVSDFPNLFVLNGPNASLGHNSSVLMVEEQAAYAVRALALRAAAPGGVLRVDPEMERAYTDEIGRAAASTPWLTGGCRNWYVDDRSGRLTLLWPGTVDAFRSRLARADGSEFLHIRTTSEGPGRRDREPSLRGEDT